jgi:hypothetical protein
MAMNIKIILFSLVIANSLPGLPYLELAQAQELLNDEITAIQSEEKSLSQDSEKSGLFNYENKIRLQEEANYNKQKSSLLNPNMDFSTDKKYYNRMIFDLESKLFLGKYFDLSFHDQATWKWQEKEKFDKSETKNYLQELFLTARIFDTLIIDAGRENIISGVAYGWNPTDYMLGASISANPDPRALREQRLGAYLVKASMFFDFGQITALYSPKIANINTNTSERQLYKISGRPFDNLTLELLFFNGVASQNYGKKRNSLGSNIEFMLTDDLILHFEGSATKGSDVHNIEVTKFPGYYRYDFIERKDKIYAKTVLGINYSLPDLHNVILEFFYNGEGYSRKEWDNYYSMLEYSVQRYNSNAYKVPSGSGFNPYYLYLNIANSMTQISRMSRYYLFIMLSKQNIFINNLEYRLFSSINLYDKSSLLNLNAEYSFLNYFKTGVIYSYYFGKEKSEFGLSHELYSIMGYISAYF